MGETMRTSEIRREMNPNIRETDVMYVVDMYEDGVLVETRKLPNKSIHYANEVSENWDNGIIKNERK
jgi:hypothetical protein